MDPGYSDGDGTNAIFDYPTDIVIDTLNGIFVVDANNTVIRRIAPDGTLTEYARCVALFFIHHQPIVEIFRRSINTSGRLHECACV